MKQEQIKIGNVYAAKITDQVVPVRIDAERTSEGSTGHSGGGGWDGTNLKTKRKVVIKNAAKLRRQITTPEARDIKLAPKQRVKKKLTAAERRARLAASNAKPKAGTTKTEKAKPDKPVAAKKVDASQEKRLSLIDAAVQVLSDAKEPMNTKQMVEQVTERKLWSPRSGGKTPHATLYSAILRELQKKGDEARFTKVERGQFTLAKKGA